MCELPIPRATDDILLTREVRARVPDLEIEQPLRNDALLSDIGRRTGGLYYVGMPAVMGRGGMPSLASKKHRFARPATARQESACTPPARHRSSAASTPTIS